MTPLTLGAIALVLGLVVGTTTVLGAPFLAIPIVLIALVVIGLGQFNRRRSGAMAGQHMRERREKAGLESVEPVAEDRATLTETTPRTGGGG